MKIIKPILKLIIGCIFVVSLLGIIVIQNIETTIMDKEYVLEKMEKNNYYGNLYSNIVNEFKGYIGPSGLDEKVLNDIITIDQVEDDVKKMINNIYNDSSEELKIETSGIEEKLHANIENYLEEENLKAENDKALKEFEKKIGEEYSNSITFSKYYKYAKKITSIKVKNTSKKIKGLCIFGTIASIIGIILLNMKKNRKILPEIMTFMLSCGIIMKATTYYVAKKIIINNITILNTSISIVIREILNDLYNIIDKIGITMIITSLILIILNNILILSKEEKDV